MKKATYLSGGCPASPGLLPVQQVELNVEEQIQKSRILLYLVVVYPRLSGYGSSNLSTTSMQHFMERR